MKIFALLLLLLPVTAWGNSAWIQEVSCQSSSDPLARLRALPPEQLLKTTSVPADYIETFSYKRKSSSPVKSAVTVTFSSPKGFLKRTYKRKGEVFHKPNYSVLRLEPMVTRTSSENWMGKRIDVRFKETPNSDFQRAVVIVYSGKEKLPMEIFREPLKCSVQFKEKQP